MLSMQIWFSSSFFFLIMQLPFGPQLQALIEGTCNWVTKEIESPHAPAAWLTSLVLSPSVLMWNDGGEVQSVFPGGDQQSPSMTKCKLSLRWSGWMTAGTPGRQVKATGVIWYLFSHDLEAESQAAGDWPLSVKQLVPRSAALEMCGFEFRQFYVTDTFNFFSGSYSNCCNTTILLTKNMTTNSF